MSDKIVVRIDPDIQDLVPGFLKNRAADLDLIAGHVADGNLDGVKIIGHSMKGAGGGYGFDAITDIGARLESAADDGDLAAIEDAANELRDYLGRVEVVPDDS
ncbi:MAG: Hpt domain-containing protein [Gammaproteobacteria bacterium]|nr:Hpt domain-containing protein [Gammaproteobacteria bacterium]NNM01643.1 Hpt domain-containing protein [Gammaproteobacteria bacterium]